MSDYADYESFDDEDVPGWVAWCGKLASFSSILMSLSPIPTIRQIVRNGTVGDLPLLPYTSMTTSCFVLGVYGLLKREPLIWGTNLIEFVLSLYYFVEFTNYAPPSGDWSKTLPGSVFHHIKGCLGISGLTILIAIFSTNSFAASTIGDMTVVLEVITFASPLAALQAVLESQSSESIPWPFTLAALLNGSLWAIEGIFGMHDFYVYFPAVLGVTFAALQVALKLRFGEGGSAAADQPVFTRGGPVEMPYPVLGSVRQVVMLGNDTGHDNNPMQDSNNNNNSLLGSLNFFDRSTPEASFTNYAPLPQHQ